MKNPSMDGKINPTNDNNFNVFLIQILLMRKLFFLTAATLFALVGCNKEEGVQSKTPEFGDATSVQFTLRAPKTRAQTGETETGSAAENKVSSLEFYVFDSTGDILDPKVGNEGLGYMLLEPEEGETLELTQTIQVSSGNNKKIIVVANMGLGVPAEDDTYEDIIAKINSNKYDRSGSARVIPETGFEMSGVAKFSAVAESAENKASVEIGRLVGKIMAPTFDEFNGVVLTQEQINAVWGVITDPETGAETPKYEATANLAFLPGAKYVVINGIEQSTVRFVGSVLGSDGLSHNYKDVENVPWSTWETVTGRGSNLTSTFVAEGEENAGQYASVYSGAYGDGFFLDGNATNNADRVYVFENKPREVSTPAITGYDATSAYALIIEGQLQINGGDTKTRYWRVNFTKDEAYHSMRNVVYRTNINKISTPGYATPEEAEKSVPILPPMGDTFVDFTVSIADWDVSEISGEM